MRCPDCSKFVAYGEPSTDDLELSIDGTTLTLSGELTLTCEQCGTGLAAASVDADCDVSELFDDLAEGTNPDTVTYEADEPEYEGTDRSQTHDAKGKPIKDPRYARRYYGVVATVVVHRLIADKEADGGDTAEATLTFEEQASAFESLA